MVHLHLILQHFSWTGSISQSYCIQVLMSFGIFYFPQSMEILVIPCAAKWKLIVQSDFPWSESCA